MDFVTTPFPHLHLDDPRREILANVVVDGLVLSLVGSLLWLTWLFWVERGK
jgi:hypothetical protein